MSAEEAKEILDKHDAYPIVFPGGINDTDKELIIKQCEIQKDVEREKIEGFAQAYLEAKELAQDAEKLKNLTPEEIEKLIFRWAVLIDKGNSTGFRGVPAEMPDVKFVLSNKKIPSAMERFYDLYANEHFYTPEQGYKEFEEIHPFKDGNGRVGDLLWKIAVTRETGKWPEELPPDLFEKPKELYTEADIERWKECAERYKQFRSEIPSVITPELYDRLKKAEEKGSQVMGPIKAMFLGEKPAIGESLPEEAFELFKKYGFKIYGDHTVYDEEQVKNVIEKHPEIFNEEGVETPEEAFKEALQPKNKSMIMGLLLGYPYESVKNFPHGGPKLNIIGVTVNKLRKILKENDPDKDKYLEETYTIGEGSMDKLPQFLDEEFKRHQEELELSDEDLAKLHEEAKYRATKKGVNCKGINWVDYGNSKDSQEKVTRLEAAFRESGIEDM